MWSVLCVWIVDSGIKGSRIMDTKKGKIVLSLTPLKGLGMIFIVLTNCMRSVRNRPRFYS